MFGAFWLLLATLVRVVPATRGRCAPFVLAGCAALAVGTLQGPVQAFPAVNELLDRGGEAGDVIVNLHAQLNMLGGPDGAARRAARSSLALGRRCGRAARGCLPVSAVGMARLLRAAASRSPRSRRTASPTGASFGARGRARSSPGRRSCSCPPRSPCWPASRRTPARSGGRPRTSARRAARRLAARAAVYTGRIPTRVRRRSPAALAAYELPMGLLGFPGVGWLFAGFPFTASALLLAGPAIAWAVIPLAFTPVRRGPARAASAGRSSSSGCRRARSSRRRCSTARTGAGALAAARPGRRDGRAPAELPHARRRRGRRDRAPARVAAVRARGRRRRREHRPLRVPDRASPARSPASSSHATRAGQALRLARSADDVPGRRAAPSRARRCVARSCAPRPSTPRAPTGFSTSTRQTRCALVRRRSSPRELLLGARAAAAAGPLRLSPPRHEGCSAAATSRT